MSHNDLPKLNQELYRQAVENITKALDVESQDGGGKRYNDGKARIDLVPNAVIYGLARVMTYGASKYEANNWRRGMKYSVPYACAMRHLLKWWEGEDVDAESGEPHLYHVLANIGMLIEYEQTCPEQDDRYKGKQATYDLVFKKKD